jgi:DNA-binding NtrC family response regulator
MYARTRETRFGDGELGNGIQQVPLGRLNRDRSKATSQRTTILVVDDEASARYALRRVFDADYRVVEAASVEQARGAIAREAPDVILLDYTMPGENGMVLLHELDGAACPPAVIMVTAHDSDRVTIEAGRAGACGYLSKPYDLQELRTAVSWAVAVRSAAAETR